MRIKVHHLQRQRALGMLWGLFALLSGCSSQSGLPTEFQDCASAPCEVALEAFTRNPGTIPYCPTTQAQVDLSCDTNPDLFAGTCDGYWAVRYVYGFPGDFYECIYDASDGALVGARWAPDNHPTQLAGEELPADCSLPAVCGEP